MLLAVSKASTAASDMTNEEWVIRTSSWGPELHDPTRDGEQDGGNNGANQGEFLS